MSKLLLITDAWEPQVNGVVRTLQTTIKCLKDVGIETEVVHPYKFPHIALAEFAIVKDIEWAEQAIECSMKACDYIHIAVEGPLGIIAKRVAKRLNYQYTTAYHTMFPEYLKARYHIPLFITYKFFKWFHEGSACVMVPNEPLCQMLNQRGIYNTKLWSRGVDTDLFKPYPKPQHESYYALYVGRVSKEKNIEAFLNADISFRKVVVGDGPDRARLEKKYPRVYFAGTQTGETLAKYYSGAAVFAFPSKTDTFGLVNVEALACGTPVAGYPEPNMRGIIPRVSSIYPFVGYLSENLEVAIESASWAEADACRQYVLDNFTWEVCTEQFRNNLVLK